MNMAKLRGKVILWLLCAVATCVVWEDVSASAQRRGAKGASAATRRSRRSSAARRARARNVKRPDAATTQRDLPVVLGTRDAGAPVGPIGPAVTPNYDGPLPEKPTQKWRMIEGGVLNGKAVSTPAPAYPAIAKAARAQGTVSVRIIVDETGRVISANAVSGHPLLQQSALAAVRQWRFTPTLLSGQPVKVTGVVTVNYVLQ